MRSHFAISVLLFTITCLGCGPTAEERYLSAVAIWEIEDEKFRIAGRSEREFAVERMQKKYLGYTAEEMMGKSPSSSAHRQDLTRAERNKIHEETTKANKNYVAKMQKASKFRTLCTTPGSKHNEEYWIFFEQAPGYASYEAQRKRTDRAKKSLEKAKARL